MFKYRQSERPIYIVTVRVEVEPTGNVMFVSNGLQYNRQQ